MCIRSALAARSAASSMRAFCQIPVRRGPKQGARRRNQACRSDARGPRPYRRLLRRGRRLRRRGWRRGRAAQVGHQPGGEAVEARHDEAAQVDGLLLDGRLDAPPPVRRRAGGLGAAALASGAPASSSTGASAGSSRSRRSGTRCSSYSTFDTSTGLTCFGSTPIAPSARAWPTYSSPSCEVYIMIGIMAVCGLPLIAWTASSPSMPGIRWSMKIASGRSCCRYSMACSADSAMSTSISYFSSMRLRMTRADLESSTTKARFRAMAMVLCTPF